MCAHEFQSEGCLLVRYGANPNYVPPDGRGPMYWAAICNNNDLMALMLKHGGRVDHQRPQDGVTPLMVAAAHGNAVMVRMLLEAGMDPMKQAKDGQRAVDRARATKKQEVVAILEKAMHGKG